METAFSSNTCKFDNPTGQTQAVVVAVMDTRADLLRESTLPKPTMSTTPAQLDESEVAMPTHPNKLEAFNVVPDVMAYISSLHSTKTRFRKTDPQTFQVCTCVASCQK